MKRKIVQLGNPALTQKAEIVTDFKNSEFQKLVDDLLETVKATGDRGAGLAANQVGVLKSVTVVLRMDLLNDESNVAEKNLQTWEVLVNPSYTYQSQSKSTYWEGCLSINNGDLFGEVTRSKKIEIEYQDRHGNKKNLKASNYFAHLIQHEIDHLNGVLFTKYVPDPSKLYTSKELEEME